MRLEGQKGEGWGDQGKRLQRACAKDLAAATKRKGRRIPETLQRMEQQDFWIWRVEEAEEGV